MGRAEQIIFVFHPKQQVLRTNEISVLKSLFINDYYSNNKQIISGIIYQKTVFAFWETLIIWLTMQISQLVSCIIQQGSVWTS